MLFYSMMASVVALAAGMATFHAGVDDRDRVASARRKMREAGISFPKGSARERDAMLVLLDGGSIEDVLSKA